MLLYLIRHGRTEWNEARRVMGHTAVPLCDDGRAGIEALARALAGHSIPVVYTSTVARAVESAAILARAWGAAIREEPDLAESPFEGWVGKTYDDLSGDPEFELYMTRPTRSRFSAREGIVDVQRRALEAVGRMRRAAGEGGRVAAVSHSDVIKPILTHVLGMNLDAMHRLAIANASVTLVDFGAKPARVRYINLVPWKWERG